MSSENNETRVRILEAALALLEDPAQKNVRMSDIAKRAGISRQALYLHFKTRAELLIEATFYFDDLKGTEEQLAPSRAATTGVERLDAYMRAWGAYLPVLYGIAKAFLLMIESDEEAKAAWTQRMQDMREGCEAAILALKRDDCLTDLYTVEEATDLLWTMMSVRNWEQLTQDCGWSAERYTENLILMAEATFVKKG